MPVIPLYLVNAASSVFGGERSTVSDQQVVKDYIATSTVQVTGTAKTLLTLGHTLVSRVTELKIHNLSATEPIYYAPASGVTADDAATGGVRIEPLGRERLEWKKRDLDRLYFVAANPARVRLIERGL